MPDGWLSKSGAIGVHRSGFSELYPGMEYLCQLWDRWTHSDPSRLDHPRNVAEVN